MSLVYHLRKRINMRFLILLIGANLILSPSVGAGGFADAICRADGLQGRIMWCDAEANQDYLSTRGNVAEVVRRCKEAGVNTIVVDVKPLSGYALYASTIAPRLADRADSGYPKDYDLLRVMIEEGHREGLKVHVAINVFSEGSQAFRSGTAYDHPAWQCVNYEPDYWARRPDGDGYPIARVDSRIQPGRLYLFMQDAAGTLADTSVFRTAVDSDGVVVASFAVNEVATSVTGECAYVLAGNGAAGDWLAASAKAGNRLAIEVQSALTPVSRSSAEHLAIFVNPADNAVRDYELSIIQEIAENYDIDGLALDRMRYPSIRADFSEISRQRFEAWLKRKVERWPEDIYRIKSPAGDIERGRYFKQWLEWRARLVRDFLADVRCALKETKPSAALGVYVGSWYSEYYGVGVNWASPRYKPPYDWATDSYNTTGYAGLVDYLCAGCYYPIATKEEARSAGSPESATVEGAAAAANDIVTDDTFVYASLYLLDYQNRPEAFAQAMRTGLSSTQGVMLFDLVYVRNYDWWSLLKQTFGSPAQAPHDAEGLIEKVREMRRLADSREGG